MSGLGFAGVRACMAQDFFRGRDFGEARQRVSLVS